MQASNQSKIVEFCQLIIHMVIILNE